MNLIELKEKLNSEFGIPTDNDASSQANALNELCAPRNKNRGALIELLKNNDNAEVFRTYLLELSYQLTQQELGLLKRFPLGVQLQKAAVAQANEFVNKRISIRRENKTEVAHKIFKLHFILPSSKRYILANPLLRMFLRQHNLTLKHLRSSDEEKSLEKQFQEAERRHHNPQDVLKARLSLFDVSDDLPANEKLATLLLLKNDLFFLELFKLRHGGNGTAEFRQYVADLLEDSPEYYNSINGSYLRVCLDADDDTMAAATSTTAAADNSTTSPERIHQALVKKVQGSKKETPMQKLKGELQREFSISDEMTPQEIADRLLEIRKDEKFNDLIHKAEYKEVFDNYLILLIKRGDENVFNKLFKSRFGILLVRNSVKRKTPQFNALYARGVWEKAKDNDNDSHDYYIEFRELDIETQAAAAAQHEHQDNAAAAAAVVCKAPQLMQQLKQKLQGFGIKDEMSSKEKVSILIQKRADHDLLKAVNYSLHLSQPYPRGSNEFQEYLLSLIRDGDFECYTALMSSRWQYCLVHNHRELQDAIRDPTAHRQHLRKNGLAQPWRPVRVGVNNNGLFGVGGGAAGAAGASPRGCAPQVIRATPK